MMTWIGGRWVRYEEQGQPTVFVRLNEAGEATEVHIDGGGAPVTAAALRALPLAKIRSMAEDPAMTAWARWDEPDPDAPEPLASLHAAFGPTQRSRKTRSRRHEARLSPSSPAAGLTEEFLGQVADSYRAAVARGERPNKALSEQSGYPVRTVERWVYLARKKGVLAATKPGSIG